MSPFFELLFIQVKIFDLVDILLVAGLLYTLYYLLRGTAAINIFLGIVTIFLFWRVVSALQMALLSEILGAFVSVGFIALIIIFQPEIRQFLLALGTPKIIIKFRHRFSFLGNRVIDFQLSNWQQTIAKSCFSLGSKNMGALIVIVRQHNLFEYIQTGIRLDANLSQPLIENIFFKNSPLHDGAMILNGNKIKAAGCILQIGRAHV